MNLMHARGAIDPKSGWIDMRGSEQTSLKINLLNS